MEDNQQLIDAYLADKTQANWNALVLYYLPLVDRVAKVYHSKYPLSDFDDIIQLARLIFLQELIKFNPHKSKSLAGYICATVKNRLMSDYLHTCRHNAPCSSIEEIQNDHDGLSVDIPYFDRDERDIDPRIKDIREVAAPAPKELQVVDILLGNTDNLRIIQLEDKYGLPRGRIDNIKTRIKQKLFDVNYVDYYTVHSREYYQKNKTRIKKYNHDRYYRLKKEKHEAAKILQQR